MMIRRRSAAIELGVARIEAPGLFSDEEYPAVETLLIDRRPAGLLFRGFYVGFRSPRSPGPEAFSPLCVSSTPAVAVLTSLVHEMFDEKTR
jgi:hypothetical protein